VVAEEPGAPTTTELRDYLAQSLPDYMIPAFFVVLDEFPLTVNGKLDRNALPAPEGRPELAAAFVAPNTSTEEILASIWREVLGLERVGVNDNFFELGGDSLLSIQVAIRARDAFGIELPLRALFQSPTVAEVAANVERLVIEDVKRMSVEELEDTVRLDAAAHEEVEDAF